jgi:hypothetical protein
MSSSTIPLHSVLTASFRAFSAASMFLFLHQNPTQHNGSLYFSILRLATSNYQVNRLFPPSSNCSKSNRLFLSFFCTDSNHGFSTHVTVTSSFSKRFPPRPPFTILFLRIQRLQRIITLILRLFQFHTSTDGFLHLHFSVSSSQV